MYSVQLPKIKERETNRVATEHTGRTIGDYLPSKRNPSGNHRSLIDLSDVSARTRQRRSIAYSVHPIYDLNRELAIRRDIYQAEPP
jgi:hypothetical protein